MLPVPPVLMARRGAQSAESSESTFAGILRRRSAMLVYRARSLSRFVLTFEAWASPDFLDRARSLCAPGTAQPLPIQTSSRERDGPVP